MLSTIVTAELLEGAFAEIIAVLPVVIPVMISYLAVRKGLGFVIGMVKGA